MMSSPPAIRLVIALPLVFATGCAVGPAYLAPTSPLTRPYVATSTTAGPIAAVTDRWWLGFKDPVLTRVVDQATRDNQDLAQARARVARARALAREAGAALGPTASLSGQVQTAKQSLLGPIGRIGRHLPGYERDTDIYDLGVGVVWDPDLFGGARRTREAARAEGEANAASAAAVQLAVASETADAYLQVRAFQARLDVARRQVQTQSDLVDLLKRQSAEGVASERELHLTQAALDGVMASFPVLEAGLAVALNRVDVLTGAQPGTNRADLAVAAPIPEPPSLGPDAPPSALIRRRPDIVAAEHRLIAANARIGAALAEYYPKVSISALIGAQSLDAERLFTGDALQADAGGAFRWRLFDFGRVDAEVAEARAGDAEALAAWRATALRGAEEVENALTDLAKQTARAQALNRQIAQITQARRQAQKAYEGGVISLVEVREADRELLIASDQLAQAQAGAARAAVASFKALGGGWREAGS